jgi:transcriptional regulator with XRE-family HTH domain
VRNWLRSIREIKGYSEKKVANLVGISQPMYHCIETGEKNPRVQTAQRIAKVLGFDWQLFFPEEREGA